MIAKSKKGINLVAIDPGETTGLCWVLLSTKELSKAGGDLTVALQKAQSDGRLELCQVDGLTDLECQFKIRSWMNIWSARAAQKTSGQITKFDFVVIEDFILREKTKDRSLLAPVRMTSLIESFIAEDFKSAEISKQQPGNAKGVVTRERLVNWKLWTPGKPHQMDALRHAILKLRTLQNRGLI